MLIRQISVESQKELQKQKECPVSQEDRALYITEKPEIAKELARMGLPCIFLEREAADVYGVDMILSGEGAQDALEDGDFLERIWRRHYQLPWTIASTSRLLIRESVPEDLSCFLALYEEEKGNRDVAPFSEEPQKELECYIKNRYPLYGYGLWSVVRKADDRVIGRVGFNGEEQVSLAYLIAGDCRHQGYALEAALAALDYARENLGWEKVFLRTSRCNQSSRNLAEKLGFRLCRGEAGRYEINLTRPENEYIMDT